MIRHAMVAVLATTALAGCSGDTWFGGGEEPPLPGERVSVMLLERGVTADPSIADVPIALPPPELNPDWPQNGGCLLYTSPSPRDS